jgi:hypothetical protein
MAGGQGDEADTLPGQCGRENSECMMSGSFTSIPVTVGVDDELEI